MQVAGGVRLRLEKSIEVPKRAFHPPISGHFIEAHLQKNLPISSSNFQEGVQMTRSHRGTKSIEVVGFEGFVLPSALGEHFSGQIRGFLATLQRKRGPLVTL